MSLANAMPATLSTLRKDGFTPWLDHAYWVKSAVRLHLKLSLISRFCSLQAVTWIKITLGSLSDDALVEHTLALGTPNMDALARLIPCRE